MRIIFVMLLAAFGAQAGQALRVSTTTMPVSAPLMLAQELGLFKKAGVDVEIHDYALGKLALEDLSAGKLDVACAAITPLVNKFMAGQEFKIIASIASSTGMVALAARRDLGIEKLSDIQGKRVGLARGTSGEFFFETMRVLHRIPRNKVGIEDRSLEGLMAGIQDGSLEVISIWEPQLQQLRVALSNRVEFFYGNGLYTFTWNTVALAKTIADRRGDLEKFLEAIAEASALIEKDPETAAEQLISRLGARGPQVAIDLKEARFGPQLGQDLLVQLEGEARWIINRDNKTNGLPNFLRCLDASILRKVRPGAVTLIE